MVVVPVSLCLVLLEVVLASIVRGSGPVRGSSVWWFNNANASPVDGALSCFDFADLENGTASGNDGSTRSIRIHCAVESGSLYTKDPFCNGHRRAPLTIQHQVDRVWPAIVSRGSVSQASPWLIPLYPNWRANGLAGEMEQLLPFLVKSAAPDPRSPLPRSAIGPRASNSPDLLAPQAPSCAKVRVAACVPAS